MVVTATVITQAFLGAILKKTGEEVSKLALKGLSKNRIITAFKNDSIVNEYADKIVKKVFSIRTLSQGDKTIYLDEIYHPLSISSSQSDNKIVISDSSSMPSHTCHCIVGVAGQGKTTIMKKLFLEELVRSVNFPFFITMQHFKFTEGLSCEDILLSHLNNHGIKCDLDDAIQLLNTKKVIFYFDGFDEIPFENRRNALSVIESANDKFGCQTITSTRPDTEVTRSSNIEIYKVEFINNNDIESIIKKIVKNTDNQVTLLSILNSKEFLRESIKTPILVDVFVVTSSSLRNDPNSIGEYYDGLFSALIYRHDLLKNLNRDKKSGLNDRELEECFSLLSFLSFIKSNHNFTKTSLLNLINETCSIKKYIQNEKDVYIDIIHGTNLIVKDGYDNYVYIHRSIQEYYCARTISKFSENDKKEFFLKLLNFGRAHYYSNMLVMLSHIDAFDLIKYYITPYLQSSGCHFPYLNTAISKDEFYKRTLCHTISIREGESMISIYSTSGFSSNNWNEMHAIDNIIRIIDSGRQNLISDILSDRIMTRDSLDIGEYLMKNRKEITHKISKESESFPFFQHGDIDENIYTFELKEATSLIPELDDILQKLYELHLKKCEKIDAFVKEKYFRLLESNSSMSSLIGNISFER